MPYSQNMSDDRVLETSLIGCKQRNGDLHECKLGINCSLSYNEHN